MENGHNKQTANAFYKQITKAQQNILKIYALTKNLLRQCKRKIKTVMQNLLRLRQRNVVLTMQRRWTEGKLIQGESAKIIDKS